MLADPYYADLVHTIGIASLGADEKQIWHLTKVYWYTVEFGVVREGDEIKAFGAGGSTSDSHAPQAVCYDTFLETLLVCWAPVCCHCILTSVFLPEPKLLCLCACDCQAAAHRVLRLDILS